MREVTATKAKTHFGEIMQQVMREPVIVTKSGKEIAVIISFEEYQKFIELEDFYWAQAAKEAEKEGFIGAEETTKLFRRILNAKD